MDRGNGQPLEALATAEYWVVSKAIEKENRRGETISHRREGKHRSSLAILSKNGQALLPRVEQIEQAEVALDELIDVLGRATVGKYVVTISTAGFTTQVRSGIILEVGNQQVLNFKLAMGRLSQSVQVSGAAPSVELASSSIDAAVDSKAVVELPLNGRDWTQPATLQPGVVGVIMYSDQAVTAARGVTYWFGVRRSQNKNTTT